MNIKGRYIVSACALLFTQLATAAGMDCAKAASVVEIAICANKPLYELDVQMGAVYGRLIKAATQRQPEVKSAQRQWLKTRDACGEDVSCLNQRYTDRLQALHAQWTDAVAYQPDDIDKQVTEDLQQRIRDMSKVYPEFALERAVGSLTISKGQTSFDGDPNDDPSEDHTLFPKKTPKGVTQDEWRALTASGLDADAAQGRATYTLMDLDGDGQRDLLIATYTGGTGLFTFYDTLRRDGGRFTRRLTPYDPEAGAGSSLFSISDRGADQWASWIKSHGRTYLAFRDGSYGVDELYLINPLKINRQIPTITVRYDYRLTVPRSQYREADNTTYKLDPGLRKTLSRALIKSNAGKPQQPSESTAPLCPIPASGEGDDNYSSYGASYYAVEPVTDMTVIIGNDCYIARLINWYGRYGEKDGLNALLMLRKPGSADPEQSYSINGRRHVTQVSSEVSARGAELF
ncbi:lysozyme inhibitor LprI family protein [Pseudomonas sp. P2757]|uniref:lysozyme inhibitor LprI family protein n=1 Tax=Pseudomonas sp. P2757 TaxID=3409917 RepID=UPI003B5C6154